MPAQHKFTPADVEEVRAWWPMYRSGQSTLSLAEMSRRKGVNKNTIKKVCEFMTYKRQERSEAQGSARR